jgi:predicted amidohydrolase
VQLAVLPEMWSSGYDYKRLAKHAAQTPRVIEALCHRTAELKLVVVGSLPEQGDGKIYNTAM